MVVQIVFSIVSKQMFGLLFAPNTAVPPRGGPGNPVKLLFGDVSPDLSCPIEVIH